MYNDFGMHTFFFTWQQYLRSNGHYDGTFLIFQKVENWLPRFCFCADTRLYAGFLLLLIAFR